MPVRYHLAVRGADPDLLLAECAPGGWLLPNVLASPEVRPAVAITRALAACGLQGWIKALHRTDRRTASEHHLYCDVELLGDTAPPPGFRWRHRHDLVHSPSLLAVQHAILNDRPAEIDRAPSRSSFAATTTWLRTSLQSCGAHWTGVFRQYRIAADLRLTAFETTQGTVYLKSGAPARLLEATLGNALWNAEARFVAEPIAGDAAAGHWLTAAVAGAHLSVTDHLAAVLVAGQLAEMQAMLASRRDALLASGVPLVSRKDLLASARFLLEICRRCCHVNDDRRRHVASALRRSCAYDDSVLGHVVTLVHPDVAPANVVINGDAVRFLDFDGAFLGCPVISLGVFLGSFFGQDISTAMRPADEALMAAITAAYLDKWGQRQNNVKQTAHLACVLGCVAHWHVKLQHLRASRSLAGPLTSPYQLAGIAMSTFERIERLATSYQYLSHRANALAVPWGALSMR